MKKVTKVIFVAESGVLRAPMAAAIFQDEVRKRNMKIDVTSRGLVVSFPEPMNQKAETILISNGIAPESFEAKELTEEDITEGTYIFTMEDSQKAKVIARFEGATEENTHLLSRYVGDEIEVIDPYGEPLQTYGLCFEVLKSSVDKLLDKITEME